MTLTNDLISLSFNLSIEMISHTTIEIWKARSVAFHELLNSFNAESIDFVIIYVFGFCMVLSALIGFSFYLWNLKNSNEHTQSRLLNILHGYLAVACMGGSPAVFNLILQLLNSAYRALHDNKLWKNKQFDWSIRVTVFHFIAISIMFLLISIATVINHFKPGFYLDVSLAWRHKVAIPVMLSIFALTENTLRCSCDHLDTAFRCEVVRTRIIVMMPATIISFLCQIVVLVDDIWSWKKIYDRVKRFISPNIVTQINIAHIEMADISTIQGTYTYNPSQCLNNHQQAEFVSLSTRFLTLCVFNMIVFLISILTTVFEVFNFVGPGLAWLVAMAITPTMWIVRNKKMTDKLRQIFQGIANFKIYES